MKLDVPTASVSATPDRSSGCCPSQPTVRQRATLSMSLTSRSPRVPASQEGWSQAQPPVVLTDRMAPTACGPSCHFIHHEYSRVTGASPSELFLLTCRLPRLLSIRHLSLSLVFSTPPNLHVIPLLLDQKSSPFLLVEVSAMAFKQVFCALREVFPQVWIGLACFHKIYPRAAAFVCNCNLKVNFFYVILVGKFSLE